MRYRKACVEKTKGAHFDVYLPTSKQTNDMKHISELTGHLEKEGLMTPYYRKRIANINQMIENGDSNKKILSDINNLHHYAYERGENDPYFVGNHLHKVLNREHNGKFLPQEEVEPLNNMYHAVNNGEDDAVDANTKARKYLFHNGINALQDIPKVKYRTDEAKKQIFGDNNEDNKPIQAKKELSPEEQRKEDIKYITNKQKDARDSITTDLKNVKELESVKNDPSAKTHYERIRDKAKNSIKEYNENETKNADEYGIEPNYIDDPFEEEQYKEKENIVNKHDKDYEMSKRHLKQNIEAYSLSAELAGRNFMSASRKFDPKTQVDVRKIDSLMKEKLSKQDWEPISEDTATTEQGRAFINKLNEIIGKVKYGEKLYGMTAEDALKSLAIKDSEKKLCRRDISLALRKSFFDNKDDESIAKATSVISTGLVPTCFRRRVSRKATPTPRPRSSRRNRGRSSTTWWGRRTK